MSSMTRAISFFAGVLRVLSVTSSTPSISPLPLTSPITTINKMGDHEFEGDPLRMMRKRAYSRACLWGRWSGPWDKSPRHEHSPADSPSQSPWAQLALLRCTRGSPQKCWSSSSESRPLPLWELSPLHREGFRSQSPTIKLNTTSNTLLGLDTIMQYSLNLP